MRCHGQTAQNGTVSNLFLHDFITCDGSGHVWNTVDKVFRVKDVDGSVPRLETSKLLQAHGEHAIWVKVLLIIIDVCDSKSWRPKLKLYVSHDRGSLDDGFLLVAKLG